MTPFTCPHCNTDILDSDTGDITGCQHYPRDDLTDLSGKHMSDGLSREEADLKAFEQMTKGQGSLFDTPPKPHPHDKPR